MNSLYLITFLIGLLTLQVASGLSVGCPEPQIISPCRCYDYGIGYGLGMDCSDVSSDEELQEVFQSAFPNNTFYELVIRGVVGKPVPIGVLNKNTFGECSFETISIQHTTLHTIQLETFYKSYDTLESYSITNSFVYFLDFEELQQFKKLKSLDLANNNMPALPAIKSSTLKSLTYSGNNVDQLNEEKFVDIPSLTLLKLQNCSISAVPKNSFNSLSLEVLDLSYNTFTDLAAGSIAVNSGSLILLYLDFNNLINLQEGFVEGEFFLQRTVNETRERICTY